jgi:flagellar biosynthesis GTPase FlhF
MTSKKKNAEFNQTINNMNDKLDLLYDNMDKSNKDKNEILEIKKYFNEVKSSIKDLSDVQNKY